MYGLMLVVSSVIGLFFIVCRIEMLDGLLVLVMSMCGVLGI